MSENKDIIVRLNEKGIRMLECLSNLGFLSFIH